MCPFCGGYGSGGFGIFGMLLSLFFFLLILVGIGLFFWWLVSQSTRTQRRSSALNILEERYAEGDVSKEDYEEKKQDLKK